MRSLNPSKLRRKSTAWADRKMRVAGLRGIMEWEAIAGDGRVPAGQSLSAVPGQGRRAIEAGKLAPHRAGAGDWESAKRRWHWTEAWMQIGATKFAKWMFQYDIAGRTRVGSAKIAGKRQESCHAGRESIACEWGCFSSRQHAMTHTKSTRRGC